MHITKLAMDAKELAVKLGSLATGTAAKAGAEAASTSLTFAGTIGRLPAYAAEIYGKTIGQLGPIAGPVVATALVAAMFAMFGKGGGKSGGGVFVPTSEQRQETQGTGMTWDSKGNKVATEGGIFGDDTAKANSITKSLEILSDNSFESLAYDNKLLRSFERVADSITGTTNAIISSGIRNIPAALQGLLGSTSSVGKDLFSKVSGFLFGSSKSSTDITSQRLELSGNFLSAANDITGSLKNVATTVTNWSTKGVLGGLFGGNRSGTTVTDNVLALPDDVRDAFNGILDNLRTGYEEIARTIGKSSSEAAMFVSERLRSVEFKDSQGKPLTFEFKDLKGDELATELNAFVSQINNISLKNLFPEFEQFKKYGEDFGTTVIKVVQGNRQVDAALRAMGSTFDVTKDKVEQVTETRKGGWFTPSATLTFNKVTTAFELSETIINKMAGSLERFTDQAKFFIDNFLTEAERMANTRADVNAALTELALPTSLTRDQFKSLVQMQDLSTQAGRDMYQGLMDIQEGFFKVTEKLEDLKSESGNLQIELLNAEGRTVEANAALRKLAIEGLTSAELAVYNYNESLKKQINVVKERAELEKKLFQLTATREQIRERELKNLNASNRGLQKEIWLREDQIAASKELTSSLQNVTSTIRSQITSLQDYKTSLLGSEKSTLTTTQQYDLARSEIEKLVSTISKPATTAEEIAVRDKAVGKLSGASDTFLGKSRELFASGAQYSTDFDLVMRTIDTVSSTIGTQLTDAEKQLKALETANTFLESISTATELTLEAITAGTAETRELALLVEKELNAGVKKLDRNLDGKLTYDELVVGLAGKATDAEIRALIKRADLNADGIIDAYELESAATAEYIVRELSSGFDLIDENLDGKLSYEELEKGLRGKATDAEIKALIKRVDKNSDELIDAYELESEAVSKSVVSMLKIIDTNLDGKLSYSELVRGLNGKATDDEIRALIQAADLNADNLISTYELELFNNAKSIIEALGSGFRMLDTNLDGKVSEAEFIKGMRGKASDEVLNNIFGLIDSDNDKLINASELNAALTAVETVETSKAISDLNNDNLLTITNNTATTVRAINQLLDNNVSLFNAMNAVAANTAALANAVKPGSGQASGSGGGGADSFLGVFGKVVDVAGNVVNAVLDSIGSAVKSVGNFVKKIFSDERTKTNISLHSRLSNGIGIYDYNYKQPYAELYGTDRKRGVLAQEVKDQYPDAVSIARNGMYMVDYSKLPVPPEMLKFAKGGIFSNQVVTRPTSFSLAQMGEAGPEAVMPLTRTSNGDLGIISQIPGIDNRNRTNEVLILEIKKLNQKIQSLEQTVAQGATMNAQATDRNTAEIAQAVVDSSGKVIQANRLQAKAGIR
jgi:Ca2+-binding EF-hand superfamily protein